MLVTDLVLRVKRDFGDEYDIIINDADVYRWCYAGELDLIRNHGGNATTITEDATAFPIATPGNITIIRVTIANEPLIPVAREHLDDLGIKTAKAGEPKYWFVADEVLHLWPQASTVGTIVAVEYNKMPVAITGIPPVPTTFVVPEAWHDDLVNFVLARAYEKRGNDPKAKMYQEMFDRKTGLREEEATGQDTDFYRQVDPMDVLDYY